MGGVHIGVQCAGIPVRPTCQDKIVEASFDINHHFRKRRHFRNLGERHVEVIQFRRFEWASFAHCSVEANIFRIGFSRLEKSYALLRLDDPCADARNHCGGGTAMLSVVAVNVNGSWQCHDGPG